MLGLLLDRICSDIDKFADTSNTPLIVLLAADPLLAKGLRAAAHGLYMHLLPDLVFKAEFGLGLSLLYQYLTYHFANGVGTSADSIFIFTTQIFTIPSLVKSLCDRNGETSSPLIPKDTESVKPGSVMKRMWVEGGGLVAVLFASLIGTIRKANLDYVLNSSNGKADFLTSRVIICKRSSHVFKSCEYVLQMSSMALDMLSGKRTCGQGVLLSWLNLLSQMQCMDTVTRLTSHYVQPNEHSSYRWLGAFTLSLNIGSLAGIMLQSLAPKEGGVEGNEWVNLAREEAMSRTLHEIASALRLWLQWNFYEREEHEKQVGCGV